MGTSFPQITAPFSRIPIEILGIVAQVARLELLHKLLGRHAIFLLKSLTLMLKIPMLRLGQFGFTMQRIAQDITSLFPINPTGEFGFDCYLDHLFLLLPL